MNEDFLKRGTELCLAVYRITDIFPKDEILRHKMRVIAIDINEYLLYNELNPTRSGRVFDLENKLKVFDGYCDVAKKQKWVRDRNFEVLKEEYRRLHNEWLEYLNKLIPADSAAPPAGGASLSPRSLGEAGAPSERDPVESSKRQTQKSYPPTGDLPKGDKNHDLSEHQERIVKFLKGNSEGATMEELAGALEVSKKTIERHLKALIKNKLVYKEGQTRSSRFFSRK